MIFFLFNRSWWNTLMTPRTRAICGWLWMQWRYTIWVYHARSCWTLIMFHMQTLIQYEPSRLHTSHLSLFFFLVWLQLSVTLTKIKDKWQESSPKVKPKLLQHLLVTTSSVGHKYVSSVGQTKNSVQNVLSSNKMFSKMVLMKIAYILGRNGDVSAIIIYFKWPVTNINYCMNYHQS